LTAGGLRLRTRRKGCLAAFVLLVAATSSAVTALDGDDLGALERELVRLSALAGGRVGVGAVHLESGRAIYLKGEEPFPMASSYKVPIAVQLMARVERGEVDLGQLVEVEPDDLHPGSGLLTQLFDDPGVMLSARNLLELMLLISDNSATDMVLELAGGAKAVTERMAELGFGGIRVDRSTRLLIGDWIGVEGLRGRPTTALEFDELASATSEEERSRAAARFDEDPRDTATPRAMAGLLAGLWRGEVASRESCDLILDIMSRSTTGEGRIRGQLTPGLWVAHKTGTIGGTTNDVGIVRLPDDAGHVALVAMVKQSSSEVPEREAAIAQIARAVHDYFLFVRE
jgi:beta-lactamase class A